MLGGAFLPLPNGNENAPFRNLKTETMPVDFGEIVADGIRQTIQAKWDEFREHERNRSVNRISGQRCISIDSCTRN